MAKNKKPTVSTINRGYFKYKMTKEMANAYLNARKGEEKKKHPNDYLRELVDIDFGIKGVCSRVIVE